MSGVPTGLGGELSPEASALVVAVASSAFMLAFFLVLDRNFWASLFEVVITGLVVGVTYYFGLR